MVNPVLNGANLFLGVFAALPSPYRAFTFLIIGLFIIIGIVRLIMS